MIQETKGNLDTGPEPEYNLPCCENCGNVLTIRDPIADSDGQSLLCRQCELLAGYKAGSSICFASGRNYGASFMRALKERSMLDPDAPDGIVISSDCCYETHSPREACKKDEAGKHLRMEAVVSRLGGETSHLDDGNVPIQTEACSKKLAVFPTTEQGWVRTDIRTPEGCGLYNVAWFNNVEFNVCSAMFNGGKWYADEAQLFPHEVVAWMPMPEYEPMSEVKEILAVEDEIGIASKTAQLTDIELQDEIDTFNHVCQYLAEQGRPDEDLLARLEKLEAEQRRRK